jgi:hypothetical protein
MMAKPAQTRAAPDRLVRVIADAEADGMNTDARRAMGIVRDSPTVTTANQLGMKV